MGASSRKNFHALGFAFSWQQKSPSDSQPFATGNNSWPQCKKELSNNRLGLEVRIDSGHLVRNLALGRTFEVWEPCNLTQKRWIGGILLIFGAPALNWEIMENEIWLREPQPDCRELTAPTPAKPASSESSVGQVGQFRAP